MDQFVVPQFIDVEDKIIGPVTTRQFIELVAALLLDFIIYKLATFVFAMILIFIVSSAALILAFTKVNGQFFHYFLLNVAQTFRRPALRVWWRDVSTAEVKFSAKSAPSLPPKIVASKERPEASRLSDMALLVNTGGVYRPEE